jgi:hypothetical protein
MPRIRQELICLGGIEMSSEIENLSRFFVPLGLSVVGLSGSFTQTNLSPKYLETFQNLVGDGKVYTPKKALTYLRRILKQNGYLLEYYQFGKNREYRYIIVKEED